MAGGVALGRVLINPADDNILSPHGLGRGDTGLTLRLYGGYKAASAEREDGRKLCELVSLRLIFTGHSSCLGRNSANGPAPYGDKCIFGLLPGSRAVG